METILRMMERKYGKARRIWVLERMATIWGGHRVTR